MGVGRDARGGVPAQTLDTRARRVIVIRVKALHATPLHPFPLRGAPSLSRALLSLALGLPCREDRLQASIAVIEARLARQPATLRARPNALGHQVDAGKLLVLRERTLLPDTPHRCVRRRRGRRRASAARRPLDEGVWGLGQPPPHRALRPLGPAAHLRRWPAARS